MTQGIEKPATGSIPELVLDAMTHPVILIDASNDIIYANQASEIFFKSSVGFICKKGVDYFLPFGSPVMALIDQVRTENSTINEYKIDISSPRLGRNRMVDVFGSPLMMGEGGTMPCVILHFLPQSAAEKLDRQLTHRNAARSVTGLASMLAHEIKNPLSGIRGAAQLLEMSGNAEDKALTNLIKEETDRIVKLVDRMEVFSDERPLEKAPVNIHSVLEHVKRIAENGFGAKVDFRNCMILRFRRSWATGTNWFRCFSIWSRMRLKARPIEQSRKLRFPPVSGRASICPFREPENALRCQSNLSSRTMAAAFRKISNPRFLNRSLPPRQMAPVWAWRWWPRSLATMAA